MTSSMGIQLSTVLSQSATSGEKGLQMCEKIMSKDPIVKSCMCTIFCGPGILLQQFELCLYTIVLYGKIAI